MRTVNLLSQFGLRIVKVLDKIHGHYICSCSEPGVYYLVIRTNRVLENPRANGINYDGKMLGIRQQYLAYLTITVNYVAWIVRDKALIAAAKDVRQFILGNDVCVKKGFETICHYPLERCKALTPNVGLLKFMVRP